MCNSKIMGAVKKGEELSTLKSKGISFSVDAHLAVPSSPEPERGGWRRWVGLLV